MYALGERKPTLLETLSGWKTNKSWDIIIKKTIYKFPFSVDSTSIRCIYP